MRPRLSDLPATLRVGAGYFDRVGARALDGEIPRGVVTRIADLASDGLDVARVHPAIVPFFEDTTGLDLVIHSRWRFPFSLGWWLVRPLAAWIGQLVLPRREARITTRGLALDPATDGRASPRAILREYRDTGAIMQVVAYATWERSGTRYMSAAFPLPGGHLLGALRLDVIGEDADGRFAVALSSSSRGDDAGVWFKTPWGAVRLPLGETLSFWAPGMRCAPADLDPGVVAGTTLVARHEQRVFGIVFATHDYWFTRSDRRPPARTET
jgi:hypothetical protein